MGTAKGPHPCPRALGPRGGPKGPKGPGPKGRAQGARPAGRPAADIWMRQGVQKKHYLDPKPRKFPKLCFCGNLSHCLAWSAWSARASAASRRSPVRFLAVFCCLRRKLRFMGKIRFDYGENSNNNLTIITDGGCLEQKAQIVYRRQAGVLLELRPLCLGVGSYQGT